MEAIVIARPGGPDVLVPRRVPDPRPAAEEVLIEVAAAGVNRADLLQRQGFYPPPAGAPPYPGLECSGRVAEVGADVPHLVPGDEVCALLPGGGYATKVVVHHSLVLPVPTSVSLVDAAGLVEAAATVWSNLVDVAGLTRDRSVLVHGAAGGIGTFAVQFARAVGASRVFATARGANHAAVSALGADVVVDYDADVVAAVREHVDGVDVVLDNMGGSHLDRNVDVLARGGHLVTIGLQGGRKGTLDLAKLLAKCGSVHATGLRGRPLAERARIIAAVGADVWPLVEAASIKPAIAARVPLTEAARAHELIEKGGHVGKVLLET